MKQYSVAIIHYSCPPVIGGVEEIIRQQATLFYRYFHPVKIFAGAGNCFTGDYEIEINPLLSSRHEYIIEIQKDPIAHYQAINDFADQIYQYLLSSLKSFNILLAHNVLTMHYNLPLTYAIHKLANIQKIHVVSWNHDSPLFYEKFHLDLDTDPWKILKLCNANIHYITVSESRRDQFSQLYGKECDIRVIPNGIDPIRFFRLDPSTVRIIKEKKLFAADFIMVQPSRLHQRKNIELSIKVIKALHERGLKAILLVTGAYDPHEKRSKHYYNKLMQLAKTLGVDNEILIIAEYLLNSGERITPDRIIMRDLYLISDLLFLPSIQEGFGIPLLEAAMIKLPTFCSDIHPFKNIGGDQVYYFSLSDTPEQIADKIINYLKQMKQYGMFRHVIKNYVWDNIYDKKLNPYLSTIYHKKF